MNFITYEIPRGVYTSGDFADYIDEISKGGFKKNYDDITMKTKLAELSKNLNFDDKSFFNTIFGFRTILGLQASSHIH